MTVPAVWEFVLGALAAWRIWKLLSSDEVLDGVRDYVAPEFSKRRDFLDCPYCAGFWVAAAGTLGYYLVLDEPVSWAVAFGWAVTTFALSAAVVWTEILLDLTVAKKDTAVDEAPED